MSIDELTQQVLDRGLLSKHELTAILRRETEKEIREALQEDTEDAY
jgi:hypothetical protein